MFRFKAASLTVIGLALAAAASCGSKAETPPQPVASAAVYTATAPATVVAPATTTPPPAATTGPCDGAMTLALRTAIQSLATKDLAAGMKPLGDTICQHVLEGGTVPAPFTIVPGKCYAVIAYAYPNVTETDVVVNLDLGPNPPPMMAPLAGMFPRAQDADQGPSAVIGRKDQCIKHPANAGGLAAAALNVPFAVRADAIAKIGSGPVAIQVYSK